jgi:hypothetical protein
LQKSHSFPDEKSSTKKYNGDIFLKRESAGGAIQENGQRTAIAGEALFSQLPEIVLLLIPRKNILKCNA